MEGKAHDATQKVQFDGLDKEGQPINPQIVDKLPEEIKRRRPVEIPKGEKMARITKGQLQTILDRLETLEKKASK